MTDEKVFTEKELEEMGAKTEDLIIRAIDAGDSDKAKKLVHRMYGELRSVHDLEYAMVTALLSLIIRRFDDDVLYDALHAMLSSWVPQLVKEYAKIESPRRRAQMMAYGLRGHGQPMKVEEDAEKFIFTMQPCGSGGLLVKNGSYGPPRNFCRVDKPQMITYGIKDFPAYCAHCIFHEIVGMEETGVPLFVVFPSDRPGEEPCHFVLYKDPRAIPAEYYERAGKKKPEW